MISLLITCLEAPSYTSKMHLSSCAQLIVALVNIKESSVKNSWFTLGAPHEILMPSILPSHSAFYSIVDMKKSISPPNLWGLEYITPNLWNSLYHPLNFSKPVKLPPKSVLKNHSKSQKNHKIKNSIVLDSKWVDLHNEYIIWYILVHSLQLWRKV